MNRLYSILYPRRAAALEEARALETKRREWERKRQIEAAIERRISEGNTTGGVQRVATTNTKGPNEARAI